MRDCWEPAASDVKEARGAGGGSGVEGSSGGDAGRSSTSMLKQTVQGRVSLSNGRHEKN
jgi:hypothetical protein